MIKLKLDVLGLTIACFFKSFAIYGAKKVVKNSFSPFTKPAVFALCNNHAGWRLLHRHRQDKT